MINQKENRKVIIGSWWLKLLPRAIKTKTKTKDQPTNNHKNTGKTKNDRITKAMGNITPTMCQYSRNGLKGDIDT